MGTRPSDRPLRSDAARNRAALVKTASAAFRDDGLTVSVNEIARRAEVNVATLYRHFPTKEHLIDAVFEAILEPIATARDRALATAGDGDVLAVFIREATQLQGEHRGLVEALGAQPSGASVRDRLRAPAMAIVEPIVERAHQDGELRAEFDAADVLIVLRMISVVSGSVARTAKGIDRYVDFALRGLR